MASTTRKRKYRYSVECKECNSVFDSGYKVALMKNMHNGQNFECIAVLEASQSTLSGYFAKAPVKCTAGESGQEQEQADSEQCHSVIREIHEEEQAKDQQAYDENSTEKETFQAPHEKDQAKDQQAHDKSSTEKETFQAPQEKDQAKDQQAHDKSSTEKETFQAPHEKDQAKDQQAHDKSSTEKETFQAPHEKDQAKDRQAHDESSTEKETFQAPHEKYQAKDQQAHDKSSTEKETFQAPHEKDQAKDRQAHDESRTEKETFQAPHEKYQAKDQQAHDENSTEKETSQEIHEEEQTKDEQAHEESDKEIEILDSTVNQELDLERPQQPLLRQFPGRKFGNENFVRRFKPEWYKTYTWLSYSAVLQQLDSFHSEKVESNRQYLQIIIECIMFAAQQNIAVRGHEEARQNIWEVSDINRGNFLELLHLRCRDLPWLKEKLQNQFKSHAQWTSPSIQNELIGILSDQVLERTLTEIKSCKFYSIIVDETSDMSKVEQVSIFIRYVFEGTTKKTFLGLFDTENTEGKVLYELVTKVFKKFNLILSDIIAECFDGAANMRGVHKGLATRMKEHSPKAIYVHCYGHLLNLALENALTELEPLRTHLSIQLEESGHRRTLKSLSATRGSCRWSAVKATTEQIPVILKALLIFTDNSDPSCYNESSSLVQAICNFDFVFGLLILRLILSSTDALSRYLQRKDIDVITAKRTADAVVLTLSGCRNEESFELFWESVGRIVSQIKKWINDTNFSLRDPRLPRRKPSKQQQALVGFGDIHGNFWLGLDTINALTAHGYTLRVDMKDANGQQWYAQYKLFQVGNSAANYKLTVSGYTGNSGDSLTSHNNAQFSAKDADHDSWYFNCATTNQAAWWYKSCFDSSLNSAYPTGSGGQFNQMTWLNDLGYGTIKFSEMKVRKNFTITPPPTTTPVRTTSAPITKHTAYVSGCRSYRVLSDEARLYTETNSRNSTCDSKLHGWYRFMYNAGNKLLDTCPASIGGSRLSCGSEWQGWLDGLHPTENEREVNRSVCFSRYDNCTCDYSTTIKVRNCGQYYVYYLNRVPKCPQRYCGARDKRATVSCTDNFIRVELDKKYFNASLYGSITLRDNTCTASYSNGKIILGSLPSSCGATMTETPNEIIYENKIIMKARMSGAEVISRNHDQSINIRCVYKRSGFVGVSFDPIMSYSGFEAGIGKFQFNFAMYQSEQFLSRYYAYPVKVNTRDRLHFQMSAIVEDSRLECPTDNTVAFHGSKAQFQRFSMDAFRYLSNTTTVFIHCLVFLCHKSSTVAKCKQRCSGSNNRIRRDTSKETLSDPSTASKYYLLEVGPVVRNAEDNKKKVLEKEEIDVKFVVLAVGLVAMTVVVVALIFKKRRSSQASTNHALEIGIDNAIGKMAAVSEGDDSVSQLKVTERRM
eukprot:gene14860-5984_t